MSMERKRLILGGLVMMLAVSAAGRAWSQDPMTQQPAHVPASGTTQTPAPAPAPVAAPASDSSFDPMVRQAPHAPAGGAAQAPAAQAPAVSPAPTSTPPPAKASTPPPAKKTAKKKGKQALEATPEPSALPPVGQTPVAAPEPTTSAASAPPLPKKLSKKKGKAAAEQAPAMPRPSDLPSGSSAPVGTQDPAAPPPPLNVPAGSKKAAKKGKEVYTGPTTIVEQPETPMLDEEGHQRLDPDGKPMFNQPVKQQRDKKGHPVFDASGKPVYQTATDLGYDDKGKKIKAKKEKVVKTISIQIAQGTLTVDGMIGKAALNYEIKDFKYIYLYAPWIGTVVVSNRSFPGAKEQAKAFDQHTLTVTVEEHQFQLFSEKLLVGKKSEPAWVTVDRQFKLDSKYPAMGYGKTLQAPYSWPGAKAGPESKAYVKPPPVPPSLRQTSMLAACPEGQMRPAPASPTAAPKPCVVVEGAMTAETPAETAAPAADATPAAAAPETPAATPAPPPGAPAPSVPSAPPPITS